MRRALCICRPIVGALTDGLRWTFYRLLGSVYDMSDDLTHKNDSMEILQILRECFEGKIVSLVVDSD